MKREARSLVYFLILTSLSLLIACQKDEPPPVVPPDDLPSVDTNWVRVPQGDIPWPSLASSPWPMYLHDPQHTGRSQNRGPQQGIIDWSYQTGAEVYGSPSINSDGTVLIQSWDHFLYALTPAGGVAWRFDMGTAAESNPTIAADGTIYAGSAGTAFYALSGGGQIRWNYDVGSSLRSGAVPSYDGEALYFVAENRDQTTLGRWGLYALNRSGSLRWVFAPPEKDLFPNAVAMSPDGKTLYCPGFGRYQAAIYAVDTSGVLRWRYVGQGFGTHVETSSPCVDNNGNIYFATGDYLYSLTSSGTLRWQAYARSELGCPAIGRDGSIYLAGLNDFMAFDNNGKLRWKYPIQLCEDSPSIDADGTIYLGTATYRTSADTTNFLAINPNGSLKFRLCLRGADGRALDIDTSPAIGADGSIYVGSDRPQGYRVFRIK